MREYQTRILEMVRQILKEDEAYKAQTQKKHGAATFCCQCKKNTFVGLYPHFHVFRRHLCAECGSGYSKLLEVHGLFN